MHPAHVTAQHLNRPAVGAPAKTLARKVKVPSVDCTGSRRSSRRATRTAPGRVPGVNRDATVDAKETAPM